MRKETVFKKKRIYWRILICENLWLQHILKSFCHHFARMAIREIWSSSWSGSTNQFWNSLRDSYGTVVRANHKSTTQLWYVQIHSGLFQLSLRAAWILFCLVKVLTAHHCAWWIKGFKPAALNFIERDTFTSQVYLVISVHQPSAVDLWDKLCFLPPVCSDWLAGDSRWTRSLAPLILEDLVCFEDMQFTGAT